MLWIGYRRIRHWRDTFFHTDTLPEEWVETIIMHSQSNLSTAINCSFIVVFLFLKKNLVAIDYLNSFKDDGPFYQTYQTFILSSIF